MNEPRQIWTISELTARVKDLLEEQFAACWVEGEISNFRISGAGHAYFTLKDEGAQLKAVLFRGKGRRVRFEPQDGLHVLAFGGLDLYAQRGEYQLVVELLEPKGLGALQLAFEQLKARLAAEGLFDPERKRPLPRFPKKIGIVTSPGGAAIRDILQIISHRFADLHIVIAPVRVQGEEASGEIVGALDDLNRLGDLDVIIVARGGGSLEDLWAFNEESVTRAIAASKVPVISAVGHETDVTIADFVADYRAPTPSAAAALVVEEKQAVAAWLVDLAGRLTRALRQQVLHHRERVERLARQRVLTDPARPVRDLERRVDELAARLTGGLRAARRDARHRHLLATNSLRSHNPLARIASVAALLTQLDGRLRSGVGRTTERAGDRLRVVLGQLDTLSPLAVLRRGFSLTRLPTGEIVRSGRQVAPGSLLEVLLHEGTLGARVIEVREQDDRPQV